MNENTKFFLKALWKKGKDPLLSGAGWTAAFVWVPILTHFIAGSEELYPSHQHWTVHILLFVLMGICSILATGLLFLIVVKILDVTSDFYDSVKEEANRSRQTKEETDSHEERLKREIVERLQIQEAASARHRIREIDASVVPEILVHPVLRPAKKKKHKPSFGLPKKTKEAIEPRGRNRLENVG